MSRQRTAEGLVDELLAHPTPARRVVAIAGPPGSGKSTLVADMVATILAS